MRAADGEWMQSILGLQVLQSLAGKILPWCGRDFQYNSVHTTTVVRYPDISYQTAEYLDTTSVPEIDTPVPIPASLLQKIMPTLMGTAFEPDISKSTQAATSMQRIAAEAKDLGLPENHIAEICAGVYGVGVIKAEMAKQQTGTALLAAFERLNLNYPSASK
jgi:hypothetical protein